VQAAARCAGGTLRSLNMNDLGHLLPFEAILDLAQANAGSLTALLVASPRTSSEVRVAQLTELLAAAPRLATFECGVHGSVDDLSRILRKEPPFAAVRCASAFVEQSAEDYNVGVLVDVLPLAVAASSL
jgi:hypothetical protein